MLRTEDWQAALTAQKEMFLALDQVVELTGELEEAMLRRDAISSRLFLNMRKEQLLAVSNSRARLEEMCNTLPQEESQLLRDILSGRVEQAGEAQPLVEQVRRTRALFERAARKDRSFSRKVAGNRSFYRE